MEFPNENAPGSLEVEDRIGLSYDKSKLAIGYLLIPINFWLDFEDHLGESLGATPTLLIFMASMAILTMLYILFLIFDIHKYFRTLSKGAYPIGPWEAALKSLIPLYNLYWAFKWMNSVFSFFDPGDGEFKKMNLAAAGILSGLFIYNKYSMGIGLIVQLASIKKIMAAMDSSIAAGNLRIRSAAQQAAFDKLQVEF